MEVLNSLPKITALGLFDVNPHLIPAVGFPAFLYLAYTLIQLTLHTHTFFSWPERHLLI